MAHTPPPQDNPIVLFPIDADAVAVVGLIWRPLASALAQTSEIRRVVWQEQCRYGVLHKSAEQLQCGLIADLPRQGRYYSAALLLKEQLGDEWLVIFRLQDQRYLLLGIARGQIVPGCDVVLNSIEEVKERLENYKTLFTWQKIYAPPELLPDSEELNLEQLLKGASLKPIHQLSLLQKERRWKRKLFWLGTVLILLSSGFYLLRRHQQSCQQQLQIVQQRLLQQERLKQQQYQKKQQLDHSASPWLSQPEAGEVLTLCTQAINGYPLVMGGWRFMHAKCDTSGAWALYQQVDPSMVDHFLMTLTAQDRSDLTLQGTRQAKIVRPVQLSNARRYLPLPRLLNTLSALQRQLMVGTVTGNIDELRSSTQKSVSFSLTTSIFPLSALQGVDLTGMVVHSVEMQLGASGGVMWHFTGTMYGK